MSNKLVSRLLSFTLSATVALTSGVPALAYDGGGGEDLLEVEDEELLEIEDEIELEDAGADFDAQEEVVEDSEEFLEAEDEAEFEYYQDASFIIKKFDTQDNAVTAVASRKLFTLAADNATEIFESVASTPGNTLVSFDSTRDFVFYAVPAMGYDWGTATITVSGGYTKKDEAAYTAVSGTDYTITASDVDDAYTTAYSAHDWTKAKKITIKANSNIAKALALYAADSSKFDAPATLEFTVPAATKQRVQIYTAYDKGLTAPTGIDMGADEYRPLYGQDYSGTANAGVDVSALISKADANKEILATVSLVGSDTIKYTASADPTVDSANTYKYSNGRLWISDDGINYAYLMAKKGYKLTVTFAEGDTPVINKVTVKPESSTYVTFAEITNVDPTKAKKLTSSGIEVKPEDRLVLYVDKTASTDASRNIVLIEYSAEGTADRVAAEAKDIKVKNSDNTIFLVDGDTGYSSALVAGDPGYDDDTGYTLVSGKAYVIGEDFTGNVTLHAVTSEKVTVAGNYSTADSAQMVTFTAGGAQKTLDSDASTDLSAVTSIASIGGATTSDAFTGEDYVFYVAPTAGYKVNSVKVDMYGAGDTGSVQCTEANGKLIVGDYGKYTVKSITGKLAVTVTAEKESTSLLTIAKVAKDDGYSNAGDVLLYRTSDRKAIGTTPDGFVQSGGSIKFKAVPVQGKAIKAISYKIGSATEFTKITGIPDGTGAVDCEIKNITDNTVIQIESEAGYTFAKYDNPYVTVKVNGTEIKDGEVLGGVPAGTDGITIEVKGNGATVKEAWYMYTASEPSISAKPTSAGTFVDINKDGIYTLNPATLAAGATPNNNEYYIFAITEREESTANYTAVITEDLSPKPLTSLTLFAGGSAITAITPVEGKHYAKLNTVFKDKHNVPITASTSDNTKYTLGLTGTAAIGEFGTSTNFNVLTTNKKAKDGDITDTITVKESITGENWCDKVSYTATLPLTVKPLSSFYGGGLELVPTVTSDGTAISTMDGLWKTVIRTDKDGVADDRVVLTIQPYFINAKGEKVMRGVGTKLSPSTLTASDIGAGKEITKVEWTTNPEAPETAVNPKLKVTPCSGCGHDLRIEDVKEEGTITATVTVNYADGSKDTASIDISAVAATRGYQTVAFVTVNGQTSIATSSQDIDLEKKSGGVNNAQVRYRVFESLKGTLWATLESEIIAMDKVNTPKRLTEAGIDAYLADGKGKTEVKEVTADFAKAAGSYVADKAVTVSNSGSTYTITAAAQSSASTVIPQFEVKGIPFVAPTITVSVADKLATGTVNMELASSGTGYEKPQLKATAAILKNAHSNKTSDEQGKITGFVFDDLTIGTKIALPTAADFDLTTVDPKKTIIGWAVFSTKTTYDAGSPVSEYLAPGADYTVTNGQYLKAIYDAKYANITVFNDDADAAITTNENLAKGTTIHLSARYNAIDWDATPDNSGDAVYESEFTKATAGLSITKAVESSSALIVDDTADTIKGNDQNLTGAAVNYKWVDGETEYATTPASTTFTVDEADEYKLEMDAIKVEEGQTKAFKAYYYLVSDTTSKDDALNFNNSAIKSVTAKIKDDGKDNAEVATITPAADSNVTITGLKANTTATLVLTVISSMNVKSEINVPITVTTSKKQIVLKSVGGVNVDTEDIQIMVDDSGDAGTTISTPVVFNYVYDGSVQTASGTWTASLVSYETDPDKAGYVAPANQAVASASASPVSDTSIPVTVVTKENTFGTGKIKVTYTEASGDIFSKVFDVNTCYALTFKAHTGSETDGSVFFVKNDGTVVKDGADIVEKIVYNGATNYTVSASKYTAVYVTDGTKNKDGYTNSSDKLDRAFLGWDATAWDKDAVEETTFPAYKAGKDVTFIVGGTGAEWPFDVDDENIDLNAQFGSLPITSIAGLPSVIRLTDETPATTTSATGTTLTDYLVYEVSQNPVAATTPIAVTADDKGLFTITGGTSATVLAVPDRDDDNWDQTGELSTDDNHNANMLWSSAQILDDTKKLPVFTVGTTSKVGSFAVAKISGKVGKSTIHFTAGNLKYDIPVYLNGEYTSGTETRYMEDGKDLEEGIRVVNGKEHFYKDKVKVVNGVVEVVVDGAKKLVLVEAGNRVSTPKDGIREFNNKTYYIDSEGYLFASGIKTVNGVDRLFREDGTMVSYTDSDVVDGIITVNGTDYVIDPTTSAAEEDKLFTVASKEWTWTKAADGKTFASAKVVLTSTDGRTKEFTIPVTKMTVTTEGELTKYVATASFKSKGTEITASDVKYLDKDGNEVVPHDHVWTPEWKWTAVEGDAEKKVATLTLTCKVDAEKPHTETFSSEVTATKSGIKWNWTASFDFDGKTYTDSTYEIRNNDGEEIAVEDISNGKGIYIVGLTEDDEFKYTGSPIKPAFSVYDAERDMTLAQGVDYTVSYSNNTKIGTAQIIVKGKGNYAEKSVAATFKIVSPIPEGETPVDLTKVKLAVSNETHTFNGEAQYPATVTVNGTVYTFDGTDYLDTENNSIPYAWAVENNINKGSGTFALVGVNNKGKDKVVKKTFKIKAAELTASNIKVFVNGEEKDATEPWAVKGAAPNVAVYFDAAGDGSFDYWMNPGQDYKVTFKNNKNVGTATVTISGKGNFAKKVDGAASFAVVPFDLETMAVPQAITAADGVKVKAVKFTLTDFDGNVIPASKYNVVVTDSEGKALDAKAKLAAGTTILVSATAKDTTNFTGATEAVEKAIGVDLSKAKIKKLDSKFGKEFTGEAIYLDDEEFNKNFTVTVKVNGTNKVLKAGEDFYISGYSNNIKKGTAKAYIVGMENGEAVYAGSKQFTFKITAKKLK